MTFVKLCLFNSVQAVQLFASYTVHLRFCQTFCHLLLDLTVISHGRSYAQRYRSCTISSILLNFYTFIKSYENGHAMATVKNGLISEDTIAREYSSSSHKNTIYLLATPSGMTCYLLLCSTVESHYLEPSADD